MFFDILLFGAYILTSSWRIGSFIIVQSPSFFLSPVIFFALNSTLSGLNMSTPAFFLNYQENLMESLQSPPDAKSRLIKKD